ncbi:aspartic peptidase domain-containing protein, partial [Zopfochytrium polystomum]
FWVLSTECTSPACKSSPQLYNQSASSTYKPGKYTTADSYADGTNVTGVNAFDTITIANFTLANVEFSSVRTYTPRSAKTANDIDGIVGLGFPPSIPANASGGDLSMFYNKPVFSAMIDAGIVANRQFGYYVAPGETHAVLTFGGYNETYFADPSATPLWIPLFSGTSSWAVPASMFRVEAAAAAAASADTSTRVAFPAGTLAFVDTGTSLALVPESVVSLLGSSYPNATRRTIGTSSLYQVPCAIPSNAPRVSLTLGTSGAPATLLLGAEDYVVDLGQSVCVLGFAAFRNSSVLVLGNTLLRRYYTVFDYGERRIGFALGKGRTELVQASGGSASSAERISHGG